MDVSSLAGCGCDSATADHAGEVARPLLLEIAPGEPSGGERAAGSDRDRFGRGYRSQDEQTKQLGRALLFRTRVFRKVGYHKNIVKKQSFW